MKILNLLLALFIFALAASCDKGEACVTGNNLQIHSTISGQANRAEDNIWLPDDAIGIFMMNTGTAIIHNDMGNKHYRTTGDGEFAPINIGNIIYFPTNDQNVDFISYYPYQEAITDLTYKIDVSDQSNQSSIDLLFSNNVVNKDKTSKIIELNFFHKLSKVVFKTLPGEGMTQADLDNLEIRIDGFNTQADFLLTKDSIGSYTVPAAFLTKTMTAGKVYESIVLPTKIETQIQVTFSLRNASNDAFVWIIPNGTTFESGKKYNYNVTIKRTDVNVIGAIEDWVDGTGDDVTAE